MDKIDIRDLRVENWIYYKDCPIPLQVSGVKDNEVYLRHSFIHNRTVGFVRQDRPSECSIDVIKPIPLTSDIYDQVNDDHVILLWDDKKYEETGETWYEFNICNMPDKTVCINIQYVHQLQNLLRDLGIEKEITI